MDQMMVGASCDIIRRYQPDILFIHLAHLDHTRHANGIHAVSYTHLLLELLDGKKKDTEVVFKNIVKWRGTTV